MAKSYFFKDEIEIHIRDHSKFYLFSGVVSVLGIIVGIFISLSNLNYLSILKSSDKILFDYITGSVDYISIFYTRLKDSFIFIIVLFLFNLSVYSSFLGYIFIGYQMSLIVLSCKAVVSLFGFSGVLNALLIIIPINLLLGFNMVVYNSVLSRRVFYAHKYKVKFKDSFCEDGTWKYCLMSIIFALIICILSSFILPLLFKSLIVVVY